MRDQLVDNALDFVVRAAHDFWSENLSEDQQLKYSSIELYLGIELLLKARLLQEGPARILKRPERYDQVSFAAGDFSSVHYDDIRDRLEECGEPLDAGPDKAFDELRKLRNKYVHFVCPDSRTSVLSAQVSAWHHILEMLEDGFLGALTDTHQATLTSVRKLMNRSEEFLERRYAERKAAIDQATRNGQLAAACPRCDKPSFLIGDGDVTCLVCDLSLPPERAADFYARSNDPDWKHPKNGPDDDLATCEDCGQQAVGPAGPDLAGQIRSLIHIDLDGCSDVDYYVCFYCGSPYIGGWIRRCGSCGWPYTDSSDEHDSPCPVCRGF